MKNYGVVALDAAPMLLLTDPVIDNAKQLTDFLESLKHAEWLAIDTEADSLHSYPEKLCLLQLSIPGTDVLIDPLASMDVTPLFKALESKELLIQG